MVRCITMMTGRILNVAVLLAVLFSTVALAGDYATATYVAVDTGLGFTVSVPDFWKKGVPSGNNKFVIGSAEDDFALIVTNFGAAQSDESGAHSVYRDSFLRQGMTVTTEADIELGGKKFKRFVLAVETPDGPGHVEAVMLTVGDETFAVMLVTSASQLEPRRSAIGKILGSMQFK